MVGESLYPYRIAFLRGFKLAEIKTKRLDATKVDNLEALFKMLKSGRVDTVIEARSTFEIIKNDDRFRGIGILDPPLETSLLFHYLNKKHKRLIPEFERALRQIKEDQNKADRRRGSFKSQRRFVEIPTL